MGNCSACLSSRSIHDAEDDQCVKVVRVTDGEVFEYPGPVHAKDLMFGFEGCAVFHSSTAKQPLPPETELKISEIYYLRPWILFDEYLDDGHGDPGVRSTDQESKPVEKQERKVKRVRFLDEEEPQPLEQRDTPSASELVARSGSLTDSPPAFIKEVLPQEQNGVLRMKLIMSKKQLSELMATNQRASGKHHIAPLLFPKSATTTDL